MERTLIPTVHDYVDIGLRLGLSASRTLALYREQGGRCRTGDWHALWNERRAAYMAATA